MSNSSAFAEKTEKRILVAYFSFSGNTRVIAKQIQEITGGTLFEIKTVKPYPREYNKVVEQAKIEKQSNYRPVLKDKLKNPGDYDVIFLGYPNWWGTIPMPVATFLTENNMKGKTIIPFCTHEGSGLGSSVNDIMKLCPGATVKEGLAIRGREVNNARNEVSGWVKKVRN
ncbi:MAG: flavodoxin [Firmicutes bacterium]|nr:flavodoxin [Bacillota bacterium]